ncbi:MAG: VWA domain-containing protein [Candidatus Acidiferrum sp.]
MKSPRKIAYLVVPSVFLFAGLAVQAQNPAPPPTNPAPETQAKPQAAPGQGQPKLSVTTTVVVVPVTVKDRNGNLVADLRKDEFRVFEDDVEQVIRNFTTEAVPISMVVLIDNDLKQKDRDQVEPSLISLVGGMSASDEAFICRFDQFFHEGKGFTKDQDKLVTQLRRTEIASHTSAAPPSDPFSGPTINGAPAPGAPQLNDPSLRAIKGQPTKALDDAVYNAALLLRDRDSRKRRKIILIISDGQNGAKFNTRKYSEVREELFRQEIAVYSVATGSAYFERKFDRLVSYAHDTGGDVYFGAKQSTFSEFYSGITEEARNQYTLVYSPSGERKVDYHSIEVRVRREGLTILARKGYYGGATEAPK